MTGQHRTAEVIAEEMVTSWQLTWLDSSAAKHREALKSDVLAAIEQARAEAIEECAKATEARAEQLRSVADDARGMASYALANSEELVASQLDDMAAAIRRLARQAVSVRDSEPDDYARGG